MWFFVQLNCPHCKRLFQVRQLSEDPGKRAHIAWVKHQRIKCPGCDQSLSTVLSQDVELQYCTVHCRYAVPLEPLFKRGATHCQRSYCHTTKEPNFQFIFAEAKPFPDLEWVKQPTPSSGNKNRNRATETQDEEEYINDSGDLIPQAGLLVSFFLRVFQRRECEKSLNLAFWLSFSLNNKQIVFKRLH